MTQIMIDVKPETIQYLHAMLTDHPSMSFGQLAGSLIDARVAWDIERERMSAGVRAAKLNSYGGGALGGRENC